ncbi:uncharacterized protein LOC126847197 isoform X2 [Adelges cooleyi]|uniref:uncharacterized protein LOC126847197 isoform X2 n=1 Tax=Adelges cooleyi TaxID=133065 RepID=UPI0021804EA5|nr:uncharacterized protein LOC126847197 isoform X2 [Adelges cooleyi]
MKLFCFLITYFFFVNVSAETPDETTIKKEVFLANAAIELAYNKNDLIVGDGLEHVIERIVNNITTFQTEGYECFAKINYMIAIPEKTDIVDLIPELDYCEPMRRCMIHQNTMQHEIKNTLDIPIPVVEDGQNIEGLNITTLAEERRRLVKPALTNIFRRVFGSIYDQFIILDIRNELTKQVLDLGGLNLTKLAEKRRVTGKSLENIIRRHVLRTKIPEVVEDPSGSEHVDYSIRLCRLIGLYISAHYPTSYIKELWIDPDNNTCNLYDGSKQITYQKINGVLCLITPTT